MTLTSTKLDPNVENNQRKCPKQVSILNLCNTKELVTRAELL